jgi:hypothetical protein
MSNNWKGFPNLGWRRRTEPDPVNVSARLARLPSNDLLDLAESSLGTSGRELTHSRYSGRELGTEQYHLTIAKEHADQALQALTILLDRVQPS